VAVHVGIVGIVGMVVGLASFVKRQEIVCTRGFELVGTEVEGHSRWGNDD
jgi:hypothetical protein